MWPPCLRHGLPELCSGERLFELHDQDLQELCSRRAMVADPQKGQVADGAK
jgi:hypothetical protein